MLFCFYNYVIPSGFLLLAIGAIIISPLQGFMDIVLISITMSFRRDFCYCIIGAIIISPLQGFWMLYLPSITMLSLRDFMVQPWKNKIIIDIALQGQELWGDIFCNYVIPSGFLLLDIGAIIISPLQGFMDVVLVSIIVSSLRGFYCWLLVL